MKHSPGYFSEEFKQLISSMLAFNTHERLSLPDLIGHPWMQGPHATHAEVREEFDLRRQTLKNASLAQAEEKKTSRE